MQHKCVSACACVRVCVLNFGGGLVGEGGIVGMASSRMIAMIGR